MKRNLLFMAIFGLLAAALWYLHAQGMGLCRVSDGWDGASLLAAIALAIVAAQLAEFVLRFGIWRRRGAPGEAQMLSGLVRFALGLAVLLVVLVSVGLLSRVGAVVAGFAGMLLGWSLQAPVSGIAAWALVNVKRPFRIGDRVMFPSLGLNGDVMDVGLMYTALNQVGGTIGSEEAIGRHILIPNAMLFTQVVINYTPRMGAEDEAHFLDEVVVRITFDSDWDAAEKALLETAREVTGDIIRETGQEPYIRSDFYDYGVYMRLRYMTLATDRPRITHEITQSIFRKFQRDLRVDLAIPFVYSYRHTLPSERFRYPEEGEPTQEIAVADIDDPTDTGVTTALDEEAIAALAKRIQSVGLLQPLIVEPQPDGRYLLIAGANRLHACRLLGWQKVPVTFNRRGAGSVAPS